VFFLFEYFFTVIGYIRFYDHYEGGDRCQSLLQCYFSTFDYTFKETGAAGSWLEDPNEQTGTINLERFAFDNALNIALVIIIINLVAGVIIDTFGALKDALHAKEEDMIKYCFICGIHRDRLDKSGEGN